MITSGKDLLAEAASLDAIASTQMRAMVTWSRLAQGKASKASRHEL